MVALTGAPAAAGSEKQPNSSKTAAANVVPGEVIVRFRAGASGAERVAALRSGGASVKRRLLLSNARLVEVPRGRERAVAAALERSRGVAYAEPNGILQPAAIPDDTNFGDLWGLHNTGQTVNGLAGTADADIDAPEAWDLGVELGSGTRVAVIDTGVDDAHSDLSANMSLNPGESGAGREHNFIDDDGNGKIDDYRGWDFVDDDRNPHDDDGHGTHMAGTIAAQSNNSLGVAGTAGFRRPGSWGGPKILPLKVHGPAGGTAFVYAADAIVYAGMMDSQVANIAFGGAPSAVIDDAIESQPDTLFVIAAGNQARNVDSTPTGPCVPESTPDPSNKVCVAATGPSDSLASFSNYGTTNVDLAAPGVNVLSTIPSDAYGFKNGTSMAAPHVAGAAAFLFAKFPTASVAEIKDKILQSVDPKSSLSTRVATGGRLNLHAAGSESTAFVSEGVLRFTAGTGQRNDVHVQHVLSSTGVPSYRIWDISSSGPLRTGSRINPGPGCTRPGKVAVLCPMKGIERISIHTFDLDDEVDATPIRRPVTIHGGSGDDQLTSGVNEDTLTGGEGVDSFTAGPSDDFIDARNDDVDGSFKCGELSPFFLRVFDTDTVRADATPNDPIVATRGNCEVVSKDDRTD